MVLAVLCESSGKEMDTCKGFPSGTSTNFFSSLSHFVFSKTGIKKQLYKFMSTNEHLNLPLISYRRLKSNDEEELARLKYALVDSEYGFFQLVVDDDSDDDDEKEEVKEEEEKKKQNDEYE